MRTPHCRAQNCRQGMAPALRIIVEAFSNAISLSVALKRPVRSFGEMAASVAVWVGYIALFGIAVETGVVMVLYLHEALQQRIAEGHLLTDADVEQATIDGAVQRLRPKLMTVTAVILSLAPIPWESGIGSDVMKPIAAPIVGGMITSTIHVLILVPVFFLLIKRRARRRSVLR
jgi:copper/silver efflux system protein